MHYKNHLEAVYCIAGEGSIEVIGSGVRVPIESGTAYALDRHDEHIVRADTELRMVCVFNPPVTGREVHDETGAYPAAPDGEQAGATDS
jgi:L-ectoine synthase